jgi:hypothetical protein
MFTVNTFWLLQFVILVLVNRSDTTVQIHLNLHSIKDFGVKLKLLALQILDFHGG